MCECCLATCLPLCLGRHAPSYALVLTESNATPVRTADFRGDTELHDLDTRLLERMPATTLRCLGVSHRKGNNRKPRNVVESIKFAASTINRGLGGGSRPFFPEMEQRAQASSGPPLKLGAVGGLAAAALAAKSGSSVVRGVAGVGALALGAWVGAMSVAERARL